MKATEVRGIGWHRLQQFCAAYGLQYRTTWLFLWECLEMFLCLLESSPNVLLQLSRLMHACIIVRWSFTWRYPTAKLKHSRRFLQFYFIYYVKERGS